MALVEYTKDGHLARIEFNRPERLNAVSPPMWDDLHNALRSFANDPDIQVAIISGRGRSFCAGRDLKIQAEDNDVPFWPSVSEWGIFGVPPTDKVLIAAVHGYAIGAGWYLTAGCDIRIAGESAQFGMAEIASGTLGPYWFPMSEVVPWAAGCEIALLGERVSAARAFQLGLVNEVVPDAMLLSTAESWARKLLALPPLHLQKTKAMMRRMRPVPSTALRELEMDARAYLNTLSDTKEAAKAFAEKRPPEFLGR